ncbi:hypothetical protein D3C85_1610480 [compost metagenome]
MADAARQRQWAVVERADFVHQRDRVDLARVAARAGGHQDQAVDARFQRAFGVPHRGHVVIDQPAVGMHGLHHGFRCMQ